MVKYGTVAGLHAPVQINAFRCAFRSATAAMDEPDASASTSSHNSSNSTSSGSSAVVHQNNQQQHQQRIIKATTTQTQTVAAVASSELQASQQQQQQVQLPKQQQLVQKTTSTAVGSKQQQQQRRQHLPPITLAASPTTSKTAAAAAVVVVVSSSSSQNNTTARATTVGAAQQQQQQSRSSEMTNYNMDHLYCHPNEKGSPKVTVTTAMPQQQQQHPQPQHRVQHLASSAASVATTATTTTTAAVNASPNDSNTASNAPPAPAPTIATAPAALQQPDVTTVLREIKHLKEMLMLHLDLIQEQNDQLITRDKLVTALRKDNEMLRARFAKLLASTSGGTTTTTTSVVVGPRHTDKVLCVADVNVVDSAQSGSKAAAGGKGKTMQPSTALVSAAVLPPAQVPHMSPVVVTTVGSAVPPSRISPLAVHTSVSITDTEMMEIELPVLNARHNILANISKKVINSCTKQLDNLTQLIAGGKPTQAEVVSPASSVVVAATTSSTASIASQPIVLTAATPAPIPRTAQATNTGKSSSTVTATAVSTAATTTTSSTPPPTQLAAAQTATTTTTTTHSPANRSTSTATVALPPIVVGDCRPQQQQQQNLTNVAGVRSSDDQIETVCIIEDDSDTDGRPMSPTNRSEMSGGGVDRVQDNLEANAAAADVVDVDAEQPTSDSGKTDQSSAKGSRFQSTRRRRKRHDSIAVPRKRRRLQPQQLPLQPPLLTDHLERPTTPATVAAGAAVDDRIAVSVEPKPDELMAITTTINDEIPPTIRPPSGRRSFITTRQCYTTRQWYMDETAAEVDQQLAEFIEIDTQQQSIAAATVAAAAAEAAAVELPRWTVRPHVASLDATGTEDFSAAAFQKRHARFELDEKKRKKWDIQRIREQRNVERLRRRLCREDIVPDGPKGVEDLGTFYPPAENIRWVQVCDDLPVQAFGELVPAIPSAEFGLPWRADGAGPEAMHADHAPASSLLLRSSERAHHQQLQHASAAVSPAPNASAAVHGQVHTAILFAKKKVVRRQHYTAVAVASGSVAVPPFTLSGIGTAATASAPVALAATKPSSHAKIGSGHSGVHSKRTGRKGKR